MKNKLLRQARFNTILLAISFGISSVTSAAGGSLVCIIGFLATVFTIGDVITLNEAIKASESEQPKEN